MNVNDYVFDFEGLPNSIQVGRGDLQIVAGETKIEVLDGTLHVNGRPHGEVKPKDRIAIDGDRVKVNGEARKAAD